MRSMLRLLLVLLLCAVAMLGCGAKEGEIAPSADAYVDANANDANAADVQVNDTLVDTHRLDAAADAKVSDGADGETGGDACAALRLELTPLALSIAKGDTGTFVSRIERCDGTTEVVTGTTLWSTSDAAIASVIFGVVNGNAVGTATITAKWGALVATGAVTVTAATPVSLALTPDMLYGWNDTRRILTVRATYADGSSEDVTAGTAFGSLTKELAFDENMVWYRDGSGPSATIEATYGGKTATAYFNHMVCSSITRVDLLPMPAVILPIGAAAELRSILSFSCGSSLDGTASGLWTSSNSGLATVSGGVVVALAEGSVTITSSHSGAFGTRSVTVKPASVKLVSISVTPLTLGVATPGASRRYVATGTYTDGSTAPISASPSTTWDVVDASNAPVGSTIAEQVGPLLSAKGTTKGLAGGVLYVRARQGSIEGRVALSIRDDKPSAVRVLCTTSDDVVAAGKLACLPASFDLPLRCSATAAFADGATSDVTAKAMWASSDTTVLANKFGGDFEVKRRGKSIVSATFDGVSSWTAGAPEPTLPDQQAAVTVGFRLPTSINLVGTEPFKVDEVRRVSVRATFGAAKDCPTSGAPGLAGAIFDVSPQTVLVSSDAPVYLYRVGRSWTAIGTRTGTAKIHATFHWLDPVTADTSVSP